MEDISLGGIASWLGFIILGIVIFWDIFDQKKRKKEGAYKIVPKDTWWKKTYIWQVFFRRSLYRPIASSFPWVIFLIPAMSMVFYYSVGLSLREPLRLEKLGKVSGEVTGVRRGKGKGSHDYITLKDDNGNEVDYRIYSFYNDKDTEEYRQALMGKDKRVTIWYQDRIFLIDIYKEIHQIKLNNDYLTIGGHKQHGYHYEVRLKNYRKIFPNLLWWLGYSLFGWVWLWFLNHKELPIHRINKKKRYDKYNLKDE